MLATFFSHHKLNPTKLGMGGMCHCESKAETTKVFFLKMDRMVTSGLRTRTDMIIMTKEMILHVHSFIICATDVMGRQKQSKVVAVLQNTAYFEKAQRCST